jgi:hypothetical protein
MSPALILSIVAILIIGWIGLYKLTPNFRRNLTAEQAREAADRVKATEAKKRVCREWTQVNDAIRRSTNDGAVYLSWPGLCAENEKRLIEAGYEVYFDIIRWNKTN